MTHKLVDVSIIGAGPTGLFAGFYTGQRGLSMRFIDPLPEPGGQLTALYPEKFIYDVAGYPRVLAKELVNSLRQQTSQFHPDYVLEETATTLERRDGHFELTTNTGAVYPSRAVIVAAGIGAFEPRKLTALGVSDFEGRGVAYSVKNLAAYKDRRVLIIGGGDSAVDWFMMLKDVARSVTLIHRREAFRAHGATVDLMKTAAMKGEGRVMTPYELRELRGEERLSEAVVFQNQTKTEVPLAVDDVLSMAGYLSKLGPIADWGLELDKKRIKVGQDMMTSMPGVFAAGDVASYPGKLKLIATGFGEAAIAANYAAHHIDPELSVEPGHSSDKQQ
ncbi:NAD(P)/FAD-dependent oxidoreductase [soil metagenome]|nr:NAD(P)/FAD-dependent oxidoreductase [Deinococcota bacterium]